MASPRDERLLEVVELGENLANIGGVSNPVNPLCNDAVRNAADFAAWILKVKEVLKDMEWGTECLCPSCGGPMEHRPGCALSELLREE